VNFQMDALQYIDVTAPYCALTNLTAIPSTTQSQLSEGIGCTFSREQPCGTQITTFCAAEIGRHLAILGSIVAAKENPVKNKHYYLALDAHLHMAGIRETHETLRGESFVTVPDWDKRRVTCKMQAFTLGGQFYADLEVRYAILPEDRLLKVVRPVDHTLVLGTPWASTDVSPYCNPIMLRLIRHPTPTTASAIISLHNIVSMAGHFTPRACAPIAILASNALVMCAQVTTGPILCEELIVKCSRLAVAGEVLEVKVRLLQEGDQHEKTMTHVVSYFDEAAKPVGDIWFRIKAQGNLLAISHL